MRDIDTGRKAPDIIQLEAMMDDQAMDPLRRQKWQTYLDAQ